MEQIQLIKTGADAIPRIAEDGFYPNIDTTYAVRTYDGDRLAINMQSHPLGIKSWGGGMPTSMQGMAIYGDILVRTKYATTGHKIYQIGRNGSLSELATFDLDLGHGNACQFAPELVAGQAFPYLYVAGLSGKCYVCSIAADYTVTIVQTITITDGGQVLQGDDGYIWDSSSNIDGTRHFAKYRRVAVSEGDVTLTSSDLVEFFDTIDMFDSETYTAQGWKVKFGKIWFDFGAMGATKKRGIKVYDIATHRKVVDIDLTDYANVEHEDIDFYDNAMILVTGSANMYMLRF